MRLNPNLEKMNVGLIITLWLFVILSLFTQNIIGQCITETDSITGREVYIAVDQKPEPKGGDPAIMKQIAEMGYPNHSFQDKIFLGFIVEVDGTLSSYRSLLAQDESNAPREAFELLRKFEWMPGKCDSETVPVLFKLPIRIHLK